MKTYRFETVTTMKEYNHDKYWIDSDIIRPLKFQADTVKKALEEWRKAVQDRFYIEISENAMKNKSPMFIDVKDQAEPVQVGYVITGKTEIEKGERYSGKYTKQFLDLWVNISIIEIPDFVKGA